MTAALNMAGRSSLLDQRLPAMTDDGQMLTVWERDRVRERLLAEFASGDGATSANPGTVGEHYQS